MICLTLRSGSSSLLGEQFAMPKKLKVPADPHPITSGKIKRLAGIALATPSKLTNKQTQELGASVMVHIEPRGKKKHSS